MAIVLGVVLLLWRGRFALAETKARHPAAPAEPLLDRPGLAKALVYTAILLLLFATPLPHVEGILLVAGGLMVSRKLATKRILGLVDWHLLVLFAGLFTVTEALQVTGLPGDLVAWLDGMGLPLASLPVLAPLTIV